MVSTLWISTGAALAHETRDVDGGKYQLRVGFIDEPAYQGLQNGLELTVCNGQCTTKPDSNGVLANGVTGAFDTLKAEVIYGPSTMPLTLVAVPYQPGKYDAMFVPTRTGNYTFHISGTLNSDKIDERFTSSPDTFDSVQPLTVVQFPDKPGFEQGSSVVPATASSGSTSATPVATPGGSTATTVAATSAVTTNPTAGVATPASGTSTGAVPAGASASDVQALQQQLAAQQQALDAAKNNASSANTLGLVGLIVGIVGLIVAGTALFMSRSKGNSGSPKPRREVEGG